MVNKPSIRSLTKYMEEIALQEDINTHDNTQSWACWHIPANVEIYEKSTESSTNDWGGTFTLAVGPIRSLSFSALVKSALSLSPFSFPVSLPFSLSIGPTLPPHSLSLAPSLYVLAGQGINEMFPHGLYVLWVSVSWWEGEIRRGADTGVINSPEN